MGDANADEFVIVGLGASAGGIQALRDFFDHVPDGTGMSFVVVLHLSPEFESRLAEVLQHSTSLPVQQVTERVRVEQNHVYVISPNRSLTMADGHLTVSELTRIEERRAPVDVFFRTSRHATSRLKCQHPRHCRFSPGRETAGSRHAVSLSWWPTGATDRSLTSAIG